MINHNVSIIIPNWNGELLLRKYIKFVEACAKGSEIIVVDDKSTDGSVNYLQKNYPNIKVINKTEHDGFSSTVNLGVKAATRDIVILLNTDIQPESNFLSPLLKHFSDPYVFAVGCMDKSYEGKQVVLRGRGIARWEKGIYIHHKGEVTKTDTAWVSGGSGAFRKSIWNELGGMDERFNPFYWEDIDISYRAVRCGYKIFFEPKSIVKHHHDEGAIKSGYSNNQIKRIAYRNQFIFIWKNASKSTIIEFFLWLPIRIIKTLLNGDTNFILGFLMALFRFYTK